MAYSPLNNLFCLKSTPLSNPVRTRSPRGPPTAYSPLNRPPRGAQERSELQVAEEGGSTGSMTGGSLSATRCAPARRVDRRTGAAAFQQPGAHQVAEKTA